MQQQTMMSLWNVLVYAEGELVSIDVVEEFEVQSMTQHFESLGYEIRSEPAWKTAQPTFHDGGSRRPVPPVSTAAIRPFTKLINQEASS